jgi:alkylation response protein AidB-like acyl-CoA dehydrogenase
MVDIAARVRALAAGDFRSLPFPGRGQTAHRLHSLRELGRTDLSIARLIEAHTDAVAILAEAGAGPGAAAGSLYGVWASDGPSSQLAATIDGGGWKLTGIKQYCSGASLVTDALVTAHDNRALRTFSVSMRSHGICTQPSQWASAAMADTDTSSVSFDSVQVPGEACLREPNWYLERPGFWHGALGPAACWAGGALSLVDAARDQNPRNPHGRAHLGAMEALAWNLEKLLDCAGAEIDEDPDDTRHRARRRALMARHLIERSATEILDRFGRAMGPQLLAFDEQVARQYAALSLYIRQCHAERDLERIPD